MSSSNDQEDTVQSAKDDSDYEDEIGEERPQKSAKQSKKKKDAKFDDFSMLRGYHIASDLDRRLLMGMFEPVEDQEARERSQQPPLKLEDVENADMSGFKRPSQA